jgi:hypothetical protein
MAEETRKAAFVARGPLTHLVSQEAAWSHYSECQDTKQYDTRNNEKVRCIVKLAVYPGNRSWTKREKSSVAIKWQSREEKQNNSDTTN